MRKCTPPPSPSESESNNTDIIDKLKRDVKLNQLLLISLEKENKELRKELENIKKILNEL